MVGIKSNYSEDKQLIITMVKCQQLIYNLHINNIERYKVFGMKHV